MAVLRSYAATYLASVEAPECALLTGDKWLAAASGPGCDIGTLG